MSEIDWWEDAGQRHSLHWSGPDTFRFLDYPDNVPTWHYARVTNGVASLVEPPIEPESNPRRYDIECVADGLRLFRVADGATISTTDFDSLGQMCDYLDQSIVWSPDGGAAAFNNWDGIPHAMYIWEADGTAPRLVDPDPNSSPEWSPDSRAIAFKKPAITADYYDLGIAFRDGRPTETFDAHLSNRSDGGPSWYNNNTLVESVAFCAGCRSETYFDANTGLRITSLSLEVERFYNQFVQRSADRRYLATEPDYWAYSPPSVYDFALREEYPIRTGHSLGLEFLGWSSDNQFLYLLNCPHVPSTAQFTCAPYSNGPPRELYTYSTLTHTTQLLFSEVEHAVWSAEAEQLLAFTLLTRDFGIGELGAAMYDRYGQPLTPVHPTGARHLERYTEGTFLHWSENGPAAATISPGGSYGVYVDWQGGVGILTLAGEYEQIGSGFTINEALPRFYWSPDERYLLLIHQSSPARAWLFDFAER